MCMPVASLACFLIGGGLGQFGCVEGGFDWWTETGLLLLGDRIGWRREGHLIPLPPSLLSPPEPFVAFYLCYLCIVVFVVAVCVYCIVDIDYYFVCDLCVVWWAVVVLPSTTTSPTSLSLPTPIPCLGK